MSLKSEIEIQNLPLSKAFDRFAEEIMDTLRRKGIDSHLKEDGKIEAESKEVARVTVWNPPNIIVLEWWRPETRGSEFVTSISVSFKPIQEGNGTRISIEHNGWEKVLEKTGADPIDWFADVVAGPMLESATPAGYGKWLVDRIARKPSGTASKIQYSNPVYHKPNFESILNYLKLQKNDYLLEIGCGGGYFLREALKSGCRAAAIDHSPDMVEVARNQNSVSIKERRLNVVEADAEALPFDDEQFTCAVSTGVLHFIAHPAVFFSEAHRVLKREGRFILFVGSEKLKGTPAEPDPIAYNYFHYYDDEELIELATRAGFSKARVEHPDQREFAVEAGVPEEHLEVFSDPSFGQFLIACKE